MNKKNTKGRCTQKEERENGDRSARRNSSKTSPSAGQRMNYLVNNVKYDLN